VRPGEARRPHRGALLLDETLHFRPDALDALRQPMESGRVTIARVDGVLSMPAQFLMLAAFNPCPCGWLGARRQTCSCASAMARRYAARLSGPLRDRLDLYVTMDEPASSGAGDGRPPSRDVARRIAAALRLQLRRQGAANGELVGAGFDRIPALAAGLPSALASRGQRFRLSPRRARRAALVARTIADLEGSELVEEVHLDEALRYRAEPPAVAA
jgi:magnesium chelatase family protein